MQDATVTSDLFSESLACVYPTHTLHVALIVGTFHLDSCDEAFGVTLVTADPVTVSRQRSTKIDVCPVRRTFFGAWIATRVHVVMCNMISFALPTLMCKTAFGALLFKTFVVQNSENGRIP